MHCVWQPEQNESPELEGEQVVGDGLFSLRQKWNQCHSLAIKISFGGAIMQIK